MKNPNRKYVTKEYAISILNSQGNRCYWCCKLITDTVFEIDHVIPVSSGGLHVRSNLRATCHFCNGHKNASLPMDFALYCLGADYNRITGHNAYTMKNTRRQYVHKPHGWWSPNNPLIDAQHYDEHVKARSRHFTAKYIPYPIHT